MALFEIDAQGKEILASFQDTSSAIKTNAVRAVNKTLTRTRTRSAQEIRRQVNFPASYVGPSGGRLVVQKKAQKNDIVGVIRGRDRPTSLARFTTGAAKKGVGVSVQVKPGRARFMRRAFFIKLRAGSADIDTRFNLGLAIRLRPGEKIENKKRAINVSKNLYLLYGPSVGQVFSDVSEDVSPGAARFLEGEFLRLMNL